MIRHLKAWTDQGIEEVIGNLLRAGVFLSAAIVLLGASIFLYRHGLEPAGYRAFAGEPSDLRTVIGIVHYAYTFHGRGFIQLGLLVLIATPVARVAFSIWGFISEEDYLYVTFTSIVLLVLLYSLFVSA